MPLREKAKNLFKSKGRGDSLSKTSTNESSRERWPSNVYQPGEVMPQPKYRRPPRKEHTEKLEAFSFADAWRKKSFQSAQPTEQRIQHGKEEQQVRGGQERRPLG